MSDALVHTAIDNFGRLKRSLRGHYQHAYATLELTHTQLELLLMVQDVEPVSHKQLAKRLQATPGAVSQQLETLDQRNYITRTPSQTDRRIEYLSLSRDGKRMVQSFNTMRERYFRQAFADVSDTDLQHFITTQEAIISWLEHNQPNEQ